MDEGQYQSSQMKSVYLDAFFPELKGGNAFKIAKGIGGTWVTAFNRAIKDLSKQVKKKHITSIKLTAVISDALETVE